MWLENSGQMGVVTIDGLVGSLVVSVKGAMLICMEIQKIMSMWMKI
jgi:hypothetical protein